MLTSGTACCSRTMTVRPFFKTTFVVCPWSSLYVKGPKISPCRSSRSNSLNIGVIPVPLYLYFTGTFVHIFQKDLNGARSLKTTKALCPFDDDCSFRVIKYFVESEP